jgi:small subunit ribosomal protein S8
MLITDPIGDMLTRIRNGLLAKHKQVTVPHSKLKEAIAHILEESGYIQAVEVEEQEPQAEMILTLRYVDGLPAVTGLKRVSKPGRRLYAKAQQIPAALNGYGVTIVSTSKGVLTDQEARQKNVGGEVLCQVW